jgi:hypothetical protein
MPVDYLDQNVIEPLVDFPREFGGDPSFHSSIATGHHNRGRSAVVWHRYIRQTDHRPRLPTHGKKEIPWPIPCPEILRSSPRRNR